MKKALVIILFASISLSALAQDLEIALYRGVEKLSKAYQEAYPGQGMKAGLAILPIEENSELAKRNQLGKTIESYLRTTIARSLAYELVDRQNLGSILDEMELSLSGLVEGAALPEIGKLAGVKALLWGSISENGPNFLVNLNVTEVESAKVIGSANFEIEKTTLVRIAEDLAYSYVAPNGIGISVHPLIPVYQFADLFNKSSLAFADLGVSYRVSRNFMISGGILVGAQSTGEHFRIDDDILVKSLQPGLGSALDIRNLELFPDSSSITFSQCTAQFQASFLRLDAQYTINFCPQFNIGLSGGIFNAIGNVRMSLKVGGDNDGLYYRQLLADDGPDGRQSYYYQPFIDTASVEYLFKVQFIPGIKAEIRPEFFITPRIALSARLGVLWMMPLEVREVYASNAKWWFYQEGKDTSTWSPSASYDPASADFSALDAGEQRASWLYYGWNPLVRPDGKRWAFDMSCLYAQVGLSFFF
jgi:TolB-like protein